MSKTDSKFMTNSDGDPVPIKNVMPYDKASDKKVRAIHARWVKCRGNLEKCMADCISDMLFLQGERSKVPGKELGIKGNFSVSSFDGLINVQIKQNYQISLDERSAQARDLMLDYAEKLVGKVSEVAGVNVQFLRKIVEDTFRPSSTGTLPYGKVLSLLRYNITDPQWIKARTLLADSIKPERGKAYLIVGVKPDRQHDAETIRLDAADCWPHDKD